MLKNYSPEGLVMSETFLGPIDIHKWLEDIVGNHKKGCTIWDILKEKGRYFNNPLTEYPKNITT